MNVLKWIADNGDRLLAFITMLSATLQGVDGLSTHATKLIMIAGLVATVAHQTFYKPGTSPKATP